MYWKDVEENQKAKWESNAVSDPAKDEGSVENDDAKLLLDGDELDLDVIHRREDGGRVDVCLLALAAYAKLGAFHDALQCLMEQPPLRPYQLNVSRTVDAFDHDKPLQNRIRQYIVWARAVQYVRSPRGLSVHVSNLARTKQDKTINSICDSIVQGYFEPNAWLAPHEKMITPDRPLFLSPSSWARFLTAFIVCDQPAHAQKLWGKLASAGVEPVPTLWNGLLEGYRQTGAVDRLLTVWDAMKASRVQPDDYSHCIKISALFEKREKELALAAFTAYRESIPAKERGVAVYNTLLNGLLQSGDLQDAQKVWQEMLSSGPTPDLTSHNTWLRFHGRRGDMKSLGDTLISITQAGLKPDAITFTSAFYAMLRAGRVDAANRLRDLMTSMGIQENTVTYSAVIDTLVHRRDEESFRAAWAILEEMEQRPQAPPNEITYTTILTGINKLNKLDPIEAFNLSRDVHQRMVQRGVRPNRVTYHALLSIYLNPQVADGFGHAMDIYHMMRRSNIMLHVRMFGQ